MSDQWQPTGEVKGQSLHLAYMTSRLPSAD